MPLAIQELHEQGLDYPVLIGGAAINRAFSLRAIYPHGKDDDTLYGPGLFYCKDAFEGLAVMDQLVEGDAHAALVAKVHADAQALRDKGPEPEELPTDDDSVRSAVRTDNPVPTPPFWGVREIPVNLEELYHHLDTHVLFKLHWGGRGVKGEAWKELISTDFQPRLERMWREQDYLQPRALLGYFPCYSEGNDVVVLDPDDHERELTRFTCPRQPKHDRLCLADYYRPKDVGRARRRRDHGGHVRLRGHRADGAPGGRGRVRRAAVRPRARRADRRGPRRVAALEGPRGPGDHPRPGPALLVGLPRGARPVRSTCSSRSCSTCSRSG